MPRKPSAVLQYKLRIREALRRRIEAAAKKRGVSANYEMASRLEHSFEQEAARSIDMIGADMGVIWARYSEAFHESAKLGDLLRATEALLKQIENVDSKPIQAAAEKAKDVIRMIDAEELLKIRKASTDG